MHQKHPKVKKPIGGKYHRNEWALIGAPCDTINQLATKINKILGQKLKIGYLNADHHSSEASTDFHIQYTNKIDFLHFEKKVEEDHMLWQQLFSSLDLLLLNGNHYIGAKQMVFINDKKRTSLEKKLDRLTNVKVIVVENDENEIYDFVLKHIHSKEKPLVLKLNEIEKIAETVYADYELIKPPIFGLILAGGKSVRMGEDKAMIAYHGIPQIEHEKNLLNAHCDQTFVSVRKKEDRVQLKSLECIEDTFLGLGPFGGILSAFRYAPNVAWLSLACDLPYLTSTTINQLVNARNSSKVATCFYNPETAFPEPLITIWEPRSYGIFLDFLSKGYACPRKVLINSDVEMIEMKQIKDMLNVNSPEERDLAIGFVSKQKE